MNVIFMGTPEFAVKPLEAIILSGKHKVLAVVTQPDRPVGRKMVLTPSPVKVIAETNGIDVIQPEKIGNEVDKIYSYNADIIVTCAYGQILPASIINICPYGIINIHASLLPKYRGASPIQHAVINGDKETGITIMKTDVGLDTGDIIEQFPIEILPGETAGELSDRLSCLSGQNICDVLSSIENGNATFIPQDNSISSVVKTIKKEESIIDFNKNSKEIIYFINGMNPWPVARCFLDGKILKIYKAKENMCSGNIGEVICSDKRIIVGCNDGAVEILELQLEGGKMMNSRDFLLGNKIPVGTNLVGR